MDHGKKTNYIILLLVFLWASCTDDFFAWEVCTDVIVHENRHYSNMAPRAVETNSIGYRVTFSESCRYDIGNEQLDWNKLFGVGFGINGVHKNSVRYVWRYNLDTRLIEIAPYTYVNGIRQMYDALYFTDINQPLSLKLSMFDGYVMLNDVKLNINTNNKAIVLLTPYFGGNTKAPHDIHIEMCKF